MSRQIKIGQTGWYIYADLSKWWVSLWIYKVLGYNKSYIPFAVIIGFGPSSHRLVDEIAFEVCLNKRVTEGDWMGDVKSFGFRLPIKNKR